MKILDSSEIKLIELNILICFDEFCRKHRLRYYLSGGTLLGAIRHKGFIPWDDDIDVCMPRDDYNKLLVLWKNSSKYCICSDALGNFSAPFTKIKDLTTVIESKYSDGDANTNLWIDIFPVDGLPENATEVRTIYNMVSKYRRLLMLSGARLGEGKTVFKRWGKYFLKPILNSIGKEYFIRRIQNIAQTYSYESSRYVGAITWGLYGAGERMLKSEFEKSVEVEFEGHKFPTFSCWDSYLSGLYCDYMQLPPVEKRQTHDMVAYLVDDEDKE